MPLKNKRYVWNNEEVAECPTVNGRLILPGGCTVSRGALSTIEDGVIIHDSCIIGNGAVIKANAVIGYRAALALEVLISDWAVIGAGARIGTSSVVSSYAVLSNDVSIGIKSTIQDKVSIGRGSLIGDACIIERGVIIGKQVVIRNRAIIGAGSIIADGVRLGSRTCFAPASHIISTPIAIQGPHHLVTLVSLTEVQIGSVRLSFDGWYGPSQPAIFKNLGIDGDWVRAYLDILNFLEDYVQDYSHLIFDC